MPEATGALSGTGENRPRDSPRVAMLTAGGGLHRQPGLHSPFGVRDALNHHQESEHAVMPTQHDHSNAFGKRGPVEETSTTFIKHSYVLPPHE